MPSSAGKISLRIPPGSSIASHLNHDLIEHLPVGLYLCDQFGVLVAYNRKASEIWGEAPNLGDTQMKFCGAHKLLTPDGVHVPHEQTPLADVLVTQKAVINFRAIVERRDGSRVPILANITPLFDEAGDMVGFMNAVQDQRFQQSQAEERARLEEALFQAQKMELIGQLTSGLAHDFNNQLGSVVMALQLMKKEVAQAGSEQLQHRFELAEQAVLRASSLADNLLRFSRQRALELVSVAPNEVIGNMAELLRTAIGRSAQLSIALEPEAWCFKSNPQQLESAILNIAINARDAAPLDLKLSIRTENLRLDAPDRLWGNTSAAVSEYVRISISDNGCGMSEELIEQIFTPFFTTKDSDKGTGLGLAMVKGFVSEMDGQVIVDSTPGKGTTVNLYFPRAYPQ